MAFKNPFTVVKLKEVKLQLYAKALKAILKDKLKDGDTVPFSLLLKHKYLGLDEGKSAKVPFFLLGSPKDGNAAWKTYRDELDEITGKKKKNFMIGGTCTRHGNHLLLIIDKTKGRNKIPKPTMKYLEKVMKGINPKLTIGTKDVDESEEEVVGAVGAAGAASGSAPKEETKGKVNVSEKKKEKLLKKYKKEKQEEAKKLEEKFKELNTMSSSDAIKKVTANIAKGRTTKKDLKVVKELNKVFSTTEKLYKKTAKKIQEKFEKAYKELAKNKLEYYKLALFTQKKKKSLAEALAHSYYEGKHKRAPEKIEIDAIQKIIKEVILMNKKRRKKAKHTALLQATILVLKNNELEKFNKDEIKKIVKEVNRILQKQLA